MMADCPRQASARPTGYELSRGQLREDVRDPFARCAFALPPSRLNWRYAGVISSLEKRVKLRDDRIGAFEKRPAEHKEPTAAVAAGPKLPSTKPSAIPTEIERRIKTIDALYTALETSANETLVAAREYQPGKDHFPPAQEAMRAQVTILLKMGSLMCA